MKLPNDFDWPTVKRILENALNSREDTFAKDYTLATLPSASKKGRVIRVTDAGAGDLLAFSDGTSWLEVNSLTTVS